MPDIKFSIILPVRNGGAYLKECINSILLQTYTHFNLHVLDNCSTDGTTEWISAIKDDRVIVYKSDIDLTIEENWSRIKDVEKNGFMTLIGHDDTLYSNYLQTMDDLINEYPDASLYQTHFNYIDADGKIVRVCKPMKTSQTAPEFLQCQFLQTLDSTGTGYMFRSKNYDDLGGISANYPNLMYADYELWVKLTMLKYKATSQKVCFGYRLHNSTSKTTNGEQYKNAFLKYINFLVSLRNNASIENVIDKNGKYFLLFYCQSLSHRILRTPKSIRKISVINFVQNCVAISKQFIPKQKINPYLKIKILAAIVLDNLIGRKLFGLLKKL